MFRPDYLTQLVHAKCDVLTAERLDGERDGAVDWRGLVDDTMMMAFMIEREAAGHQLWRAVVSSSH